MSLTSAAGWSAVWVALAFAFSSYIGAFRHQISAVFGRSVEISPETSLAVIVVALALGVIGSMIFRERATS